MAAFSGRFDTTAILLSTGRTGTMAVAHYLQDSYEGVCARHEPKPSRHLRLLSNRYLCHRVGRQRLIQAYVRARQGLFASMGERVYVESNNFLHGFLDVLDDVFDRPRIVHIVRDPRTYIRSWINFGVFSGLKGLAGRYLKYWLLKPELLTPQPAFRWDAMPPQERIAWYWSALNRELNRGEQLFGDRYIRLRFEDLFTADNQPMDKLAAWLGLPPRSRPEATLAAEKVNKSRRNLCPPFEQWNRLTREKVLNQCRELMDLYGYTIPVAAAAT